MRLLLDESQVCRRAAVSQSANNAAETPTRAAVKAIKTRRLKKAD
jgi:hypothetical protein